MDANSQMMLISECQPDSLDRLLETTQTVFVVTKSWWDCWSSYVGYKVDPEGYEPGPIDNEVLLDGNILKKHLSNDDVKYLSSTTWQRLKHWYGGGPELEIFVVNKVPDLNPIQIYIWNSQDPCNIVKTWKPYLVSSKMTMFQLKNYLVRKLNISFDNTSIKLENSLGETRILLGYDHCPLNESLISNGTKIILERKENKKNMQLVEILEDEDEELKLAMEASLREEEFVDISKRLKNETSTDIEMETIHIYSEPITVTTHKSLPSRADSELVALKIDQTLKETKIALGIHQLRRIKKNLINIWADYQTWQKQQL